MNIFDSLQSSLFDVVTTTMGYTASWTGTAEGSIEITGPVLYKGPTEKDKLAGVDYDPDMLMFEYKAGNFPGLADAVDESPFETLVITDIGEFVIKSISRLADGKTYQGRLEVKI